MWIYHEMLSRTITYNGLLKPSALASAGYIILKYTWIVVFQYITLIPALAYYKTRKLMPIWFFIVEIKNKEYILCEAGTQL